LQQAGGSYVKFAEHTYTYTYTYKTL
jgi:hypothetical protein